MDSTLIFACEKCNTIDMYSMADNTNNVCSECSTGQWHGFFDKEQFDPSIHTVNNRASTRETEVPSFG